MKNCERSVRNFHGDYTWQLTQKKGARSSLYDAQPDSIFGKFVKGLGQFDCQFAALNVYFNRRLAATPTDFYEQNCGYDKNFKNKSNRLNLYTSAKTNFIRFDRLIFKKKFIFTWEIKFQYL